MRALLLWQCSSDDGSVARSERPNAPVGAAGKEYAQLGGGNCRHWVQERQKGPRSATIQQHEQLACRRSPRHCRLADNLGRMSPSKLCRGQNPQLPLPPVPTRARLACAHHQRGCVAQGTRFRMNAIDDCARCDPVRAELASPEPTGASRCAAALSLLSVADAELGETAAQRVRLSVRRAKRKC